MERLLLGVGWPGQMLLRAGVQSLAGDHVWTPTTRAPAPRRHPTRRPPRCRIGGGRPASRLQHRRGLEHDSTDAGPHLRHLHRLRHAQQRDGKAGYRIDHVEQLLDEAGQGLWTIYTSSVIVAAIPAVRLSSDRYGIFAEFLEGCRGAIVQVGPDSNAMVLASDSSGIFHTNGRAGRRKVGSLDAIHLVSALILAADDNATISTVHIFETGGSKFL